MHCNIAYCWVQCVFFFIILHMWHFFHCLVFVHRCRRCLPSYSDLSEYILHCGPGLGSVLSIQLFLEYSALDFLWQLLEYRCGIMYYFKHYSYRLKTLNNCQAISDLPSGTNIAALNLNNVNNCFLLRQASHYCTHLEIFQTFGL